MRFGRIEFGVARLDGKIAKAEFSIVRSSCDCTILSVGWFYITYLRGYCLQKTNKDTDENT